MIADKKKTRNSSAPDIFLSLRMYKEKKTYCKVSVHEIS